MTQAPVQVDEKLKQEALKGIELLKRQQRALASRTDLLSFIEFTTPDPEALHDPLATRYKAAKHHKAICAVVESFIEGTLDPKCKILVLTMPPRHGKTQIVSKHLPAWLLGRFPRQNVVVAAYGDEFAMDIGSDVRDILKTQQFRATFPDTKLVRGGTAKDRLQTTQGGMAIFVGRGGSLTGRGAHVLICDDIIKDDKEASSKAIRDQAWNWFTKVAMTRLMGKKLTILTFTRWHTDDPIGRLTDPANEEFFNEALAESIQIINFPGFAGDDDPLGREPGEPLWPDGPDQFDAEYLNSRRALLGPLGFAALYQQRPTVDDGVLFRRENLNFYDPADLPESLRFYCGSDHAVTTKQRSDYTVLLKGGVDQRGHLWLTDCYWKKARADTVAEAMLEMGTDSTAPLIWWAENGHISKSIGPFLRQKMLEEQRFFSIVEVTPTADKEQRAQAISAKFGIGQVHFPRNAWWTEKAVNELLAFPNGLHDDFVDALSLFGLGLRVQVKAGAPVKKQAPAKYGTLGWLKHEQKMTDRAARRAANGAF